MKTNNANRDAVVKAMKRANREIEMERHGADHPWVAVDRPHKNKKKYDRKNQKKELRRTLSSFDFRKNFLREYFAASNNFVNLWKILTYEKAGDISNHNMQLRPVGYSL